MGIGDWGLGIGPNPQSPIPNPQSPIPIIYFYLNETINNEYFEYEQLKDSKIFIDENEKEFNTNFILNIGYHIIIILFNNELTNCYCMFDNCNDIIEIKFINIYLKYLK